MMSMPGSRASTSDCSTSKLVPMPPHISSGVPVPSPAAVVPKTSNPSTTRHVTVCRQQFRVDVRAGDGSGSPLLMCGGIGTSFEVLQSLVDALDPGIDIIRFDAPGVGGSPVGALPYGFPQLSWMLARMLDEMGYHQVAVLA